MWHYDLTLEQFGLIYNSLHNNMITHKHKSASKDEKFLVENRGTVILNSNNVIYLFGFIISYALDLSDRIVICYRLYFFGVKYYLKKNVRFIFECC